MNSTRLKVYIYTQSQLVNICKKNGHTQYVWNILDRLSLSLIMKKHEYSPYPFHICRNASCIIWRSKLSCSTLLEHGLHNSTLMIDPYTMSHLMLMIFSTTTPNKANAITSAPYSLSHKLITSFNIWKLPYQTWCSLGRALGCHTTT